MSDHVSFVYRQYSSPIYDPKWLRKKLNRLSDDHEKWLRYHQNAREPHPEYGSYNVTPWHLKQARRAEKIRMRCGSWTECLGWRVSRCGTIHTLVYALGRNP